MDRCQDNRNPGKIKPMNDNHRSSDVPESFSQVQDPSPNSPTENGLPLFVKVDGFIPFVEDVETIFFTPVTVKPSLDKLMDKLSALGPHLKPARELNMEDLFATVFSLDGEYYRCKILQEDQEKVQVLYVDYGNQEERSKDELFELPEELKNLRPSAYQIKIHETENLEKTKENISLLEAMLLDKPVQVSVEVVNSKMVGKIWTKKLDSKKLDLKLLSKISTDRPQALYDSVTPKTNPSPSPESREVKTNNNQEKIKDLNLGPGVVPCNPGEKIPGSVVWIESKDEVWFTPTSEMIRLEDMMDRMEKEYSHYPTFENPCVGEIYGTLYSQDNMFYRCQLEPGYVARFIDYGNTEKKKKYEFYNLPEDLRNSSPAALKIKLKNTDSTVKDLEEALFDVKIELMIDSEGVGTFYKDGIELFKRERAVKETKMVDNDNPEMLLPVGVRIPVSVGHLESLSRIWVSVKDFPGLQNEENLVLVVGDLLDQDNGNMVQIKPVLNMVCKARFSRDGEMYRAQIVSVHKNGATADVIFIDFGNRDTCSEFYKIDGDLLALPAGARPIKLLVNSGVEETKENLVKLEEKLIESEIEVILEKEGPDFLARLFVNGNEADLGFLNQDLISTDSTADTATINISNISCRESRFVPGVEIPVIVNLVDSVARVWVSSVESQAELVILMADLDQKFAKGEMVSLNNPEVEALCVASFSEDNSLYRAKILSEEDSKFEIRYIDYGNRETKIKEELLELPVSLSSAPAFAWQVNLPIMARVENSKENQVRLDELLMSEGIKLKMISEESGEITILGNQIDPALFPSSKKKIIPEQVMKQSSGELDVVMPFVDTVKSIWVVPVDIEGQLNQLMENIAAVDGTLKPLENCTVGSVAISRYTDGGLYRCRVTEEKDGRINILYVDYGNTEWKDKKDLMDIPEEFCKLPAASLNLNIKKLGLENTENNILLLSAVLERQDVINIKYRVVDGVIQAKLKPELTHLLVSQPPVDLNLTTPEKEKPSLMTSLTESERGFEQIRDETVLCNSRILSTDSEPERVHLDISQVSQEKQDEPPKATLISSSVATHIATPKATPISTPIATPLATSIATPKATAKATLMATPMATPMVTPMVTPMATPMATPIATSTYSPMIEKNVNWKCGDRAVGFWSSESLWREAVVIQVLQDSALIANTDPSVKNITVPFNLLKSPEMPVHSLNLLENQIKELRTSGSDKSVDLTPLPRKRVLSSDVPEFVPRARPSVSPAVSGVPVQLEGRKSENPVFWGVPGEPGASPSPFTHPLSPEEPSTPAFNQANFYISPTSQVMHKNLISSDLSSAMKTLSGSTMLQVHIKENPNSPKIKEIFDLVLSSAIFYINHPRSTYLVQTLVNYLSVQDLFKLVRILVPNFTVIAKNKCGTRVLQVLLSLPHQDVVKELIKGLETVKNIPSFLSDCNSTHVAQACLNTTCIEKDTISYLVASILPSLVELGNGENSTFFMQQLIPFMKKKGFKDADLLIKCVINNIFLLGFNKNGSRVVQLVVELDPDTVLEKAFAWFSDNISAIYPRTEAVYTALVILEQAFLAVENSSAKGQIMGSLLIKFTRSFISPDSCNRLESAGEGPAVGIIGEGDTRPLFIQAALNPAGCKICLLICKKIRGPMKAELKAVTSTYYSQLGNNVWGETIIKALK